MHPTRHAHLLDLQRQWTATALGMVSCIALCLGGCTAIQRQESPSTAHDTAQSGPSASSASSARDYRKDAARHVYLQQKSKVFQGRLPPMLYAVGVLNVDIDRQGRIQALQWTRAPKHAPEVMAEIERMVHAAAPFPAPTRLGKVTYTDVWLWDKSGRFQLDTLTEGQD